MTETETNINIELFEIPKRSDSPRVPSPYSPALTYEDIDRYYCRGQGRILSEATGLCRSHVTQVLRQKIGMSLDSAKRLAGVAGISIERFEEYLKERNR